MHSSGSATTARRIDDLMPVVIPTKIVIHPLWPGISTPWRDVLSVTWAWFYKPNTTTYLTKSEARELTANHVSFAQIACDNLRRFSSNRVWTHAKEEAGRVQFLAMLHEDGLGPSRLLLREELRQMFPEGFRFCVPERTCAVVFSKWANPAALDAVRTVVCGCFGGGREPVSEHVFAEEDISI
jgi:hypothetical protein